MTLTPEKLAELREKVAALQASHYRMNAACFDSPLDAYIAAADPQTVLALVEEVERLQARVAELEAAMAQRMGVYAAPKDERQVGS